MLLKATLARYVRAVGPERSSRPMTSVLPAHYRSGSDTYKSLFGGARFGQAAGVEDEQSSFISRRRNESTL